MSSSTFVFLFLLSFLTSFRACAQNPTYVYRICPNTTTFSRNSTYLANLRTLLSSLSSPNASYATGFQNATVGQPPDRVTGLYLCRGDVTPEVCRRCVAFAVNETFTQCPNAREVTLYYEECMLRYSNGNILSTLNANGEFSMENTQSITSNLVRFTELVLSTMNQAATVASNSSRKFDTVNAFTDFQTLHGLVQCTPDLTNQDCLDCLSRIINQLPTDRIGGRVMVPSCFSRFELYLFYNEAAADRTPQPQLNSAPPPPPPISIPSPRPGESGNSTVIVIAVVVPTTVIFLLLVAVLIFRAKRKTTAYETEPLADGDDIATAGSLQFDFKAIEAATDKFSQENKLGQGGFGQVYKDRNKMGDSVPLKLALPELKYPIGSQPKEKSAINQYSGSDYISIVKSILKPDEMIRVRGSFLGPVMKLSERGLKLSAKIVYAILTRSIVSVKENEAWFHFGAQPMRFSIREFHMMTGLKCSGALEGPRRETERFNWELLKGRSHKLSDVVDQLRNTREDASEERICLAMLILVESILLRKSKGGSFPLEYAKNAQDMTYPWGKEAYIVLLKSIQNAVANHLENKSKFELQGYPLVFLLWILESIPLLRNKFSKCVPTVEVPGPTYLCEKYTEIENPSLDRVLQVEADTKLKVHCILPSIPHDPEDDISIEDKYSDELETVKDVTKKGYKITADDWENRCVDTFDTLDALIQMMANKETGQASTPIDEDSVNEKVNRIITVMEENLKSMKDRMSLLEEENIHLRARVSELEGNSNVFPTNVTQKRSSGTPLSPMSHTQPSSGTPLSPMSHTQPSSETPLSPMSQQPNLTHEETMIESAASPKSQQNEDYTQSSSETPLSPMSQQPNLTNEDTMNESDDETPALDTQVFSPNLTKEKETETSTGERPSNPNQDGKPDDEIVREKLTSESPASQSQVLQKETVEMNETPSSPIAPKSIETPVYTPSQTQQIEREPSDDTPALDTQVFTPNLTKERETQTSTDETPPKTNQGEGKPDDEIVIESPAAQTQVLQKETLEMNETPSSPISPKSIEAQVFTPIQKQQTVTEETYEATQPLTEIISANNKKEDTHAVHYRPSSPLSSLIALVIEENKNALSETETATQYFSTSEGEHSQSSRKNQAEEYLKDTTEPTTELVSTDVSKTQPLTPQTQHLQTSEGDQSDETPSEQNQAEENLKDTTEPTTELVSTYVSKMPPITQQTDHLQTSAIDFSEKNEVEVSRLLAHFQIGAEVEILSTDDEIWYPGKVVDLKLCEGLEELTVEYTTLFTDQHRLQKLQDTITADKIRPATPTSDQKSFEMMDKVEAFYNNGWSSGQISMVLGDNTYSVCLYTSMETILFKHSDLRIHREWKDGVWKMADKVKPDKKRKAAASSQNSGMDNVFLRRSERVPKRSRDTKTPFKSDRNPALTVIPEIIPAVDPFSTPAEHKLSRLQNWMTLKPGMHETSLSINDNKIRKSFFQSMENAKKDLKKEHIDGAFAMLNCRRNENAAWFHNYKIPKACFLPMEFLHCLLSDDLAYKKEKVKGKKIFNDLFKDTVRGKVYPEKTWGEDVDVVYGITLGKKSNVWIGMEIHLKKKRITVYDCFQKESNSIDIPQVKKLAVLISNLLVESSGDEVDKVKMIPFEIEQAQGLPKTKHPFNCGIFLVKILECQSLKIGDMTKINDDNALELRRTLSCEIFNQFVDESFGK